MIRRTTMYTVLGCILVLVSLYTFVGVVQAASLFVGVKALRNANLWGSLSLGSLVLALTCFSRAREWQLFPSRFAPIRSICGCIALLVAVWLLWPVFADFVAADACLDAGGSFDYVRSTCDMAESQPYVPLLDRQGFRVVGAVVFGILAIRALGSNFSSSGRAESRRST